MDPVILAGMIFSLIVVLLVSGTLLLLPIARRLGQVLERYIESGWKQGKERSDDAVLEELRVLRSEIEALSDRQEFVERLLEAPKPARTDQTSES